MICRKIMKILSKKKSVFGAKTVEWHIKKQLWQLKLQTYLVMNFCFVSSKNQLKMCKISTLSCHA
jgi:hypothetical protein